MKTVGSERQPRRRERALLEVVAALDGLSREDAWRVLRAVTVLLGYDDRDLVTSDDEPPDGEPPDVEP
jgi:hypothetical protein